MQPVMHRSRFVHHMHGLSAKVSRYLSRSITPPSHARDQEHQHGTCAAGLPGIYAVNLVSHTMGDGISPSARSYATCLVGRAGERQEAPRLARQQRAQGGDLGQSFALLLLRTGLYGACLRHPAIQRARDSGHAAPRAPRARVELAPLVALQCFPFSQATFHKGTREILLNPAFSVQNSLVRASSSLLLYLAQVNPAGTEFTRPTYTVLKRKPLPGSRGN